MKEPTIKSEDKLNFNPFSGPEIELVIYTTQSQAEIWIACKLGDIDANRAYNESVSLILNGNLNKKAILKAIQSLVERHEALRSVFSTDGRFMTVFKNLSIAIDHKDFSELSDAEKYKSLKDYLSANANYAFDLVKGPLFKVVLIKLSETEHHLILTAHHIVCDGWSTGIILEELGSLYSANVLNTDHNLPKPESFCAYADEQQAYLISEAHKSNVNYWLNQFKDEVPQLTLPTDFPRPQLRTYKSGHLNASIDNVLVDALKKIGIKSGCSFVTTLLSAFEVFIYTQTSEDTIVLGLPSADQAASGKTQMIGHCVNLLPLRSEISTDISFSDYLKKRKPQLFDAYDHQKLSFGELLQKLAIARDPSRVPLVPVVFNIDMGMSNSVSFSGLNYKLKSNPRAYEAFELFLNATGSEDNLILEWSYNSSLFKPETIQQMMVSFQKLLQQIVESPQTKLEAVLKVDDVLYDTLNDTKVDYPSLPLHELIAKQVEVSPDKRALKYGKQEITYKELATLVNRLAHHLAEQGVKPGTIIAVSLPRSIELVASLLAIMQCGAAYLPIDPSYPEQRIDFMLKDSEAEILLTSQELSLVLQSSPRVLILESLVSNLSKYPSVPLDLLVDINEMAYLLYTSGSTGNPKGVQVTHKNLVNFLFSMLQEPGIKETDKLLSITTISFDIAGLELFLPLLKGATLVIADSETAKDSRKMLEVIEDENITMLQATPSTWQMLIDAGWETSLPIKALCGGEALPIALAKKILNKVDELWNMYGPTETTIWSTIKQIEETDDLVTIGRPIANTQIYIVNDLGHLVAPGQIGEICISGDGVAGGYWKRAELTSEKFVKNTFNKSNKSILYKTGDLGKLLPSGELHCLGRIDNQVKIRGHRIELGEIEEALSAYKSIEGSVVLINNQMLVAYVIWHGGDIVSKKEIENCKVALSEKLPAYMIPQNFIFLNEFPKTLNGKIDRKALSTNSPVIDKTSDFTPPRTQTEKILATIWMECLKVKDIDVYSDFFELGGHSLIAVRVMSLLEKKTGKSLPLSALMVYPTIQKLAESMDVGNNEMVWNSLVSIKPNGSKTPLYVVHGAGHNVLFFDSLAKNLDNDQPVYALQAKGLNGVDKPFDRIEDMAAHYISEIIKVNPNGPYNLAGYSLGGIVAFEMARQLKAQGKIVSKLALFDSYVFPSYYYEDVFRKQLASRFYTLGKVYFALSQMFTSRENFKRRLKAIRKGFNRLYNKLGGGKEEDQLQYKQGMELNRIHELALKRYQILPQDLEVDLLVAEVNVYFKHDTKCFGWKSLATRGVRKHEIPGDHRTMFKAPHDKQFGLVLQDVLDR